MRSWLVGILLLSACGNEGGGDACPPGPRGDYPAAPYGLSQGDRLADLSFLLGDGSAWTLADIYRQESNRLLWLTTAAGWCTACRDEQATLQGYQNSHAERGLAIVVALFQDDNYAPADAALAAAWTQQYGLTFPVVADPSFQLDAYYDEALTPMNMLVEVCTMEILRITTGVDLTAVEAIIEAKL